MKARRVRLGWTIQKVATLSGFDQSFISRLEREESGYSPETEEKIARTLKTTVSALHSTEQGNVEVVSTEYRRIPVIDYVRAGQFSGVAGPFNDAEMQEWITTTLEHSSKTFAMRIKGNSMEPKFLEGDLVIIDPAVSPAPGDFVVAQNDGGEALFKRYRVAKTTQDGNSVFELIPLNPDYPSWRSDEHDLRIVGVMMEHRQPRRR